MIISGKNISSYIIKKLLCNPGCIAISHDDINYSSDELIKRVGSYASLLVSKNLVNGKCIAIIAPKSFDTIALVLAILKVGATYFSLNSNEPFEKLKAVIGNVGVGAIYVDNSNFPVDQLDIETVVTKRDVIDASAQNVLLKEYQYDIATIINTSGTTSFSGKSIAITHENIFYFSYWASQLTELGERDKVLNTAPLNFDLSFFDIFSSLIAGATVYIGSSMLPHFPADITNCMVKNKITTWYTVPSYLAYWLKHGDINRADLSNLKSIIFAGEAMPVEVLQDLSQLLLHVNFYNFFGPTETNVCCYLKVNHDDITSWTSTPIGWPVPHCKVRLTKGGELLVKSKTLAKGYYVNKKLISLSDSDGWYHTGDLCKLDVKNGIFYFLGRVDRLFKSYGFLINPEAIEVCANQYSGILGSACFSVLDENDQQVPVLILATNSSFELKGFKRYLKDKICRQQFPREIVVVDDIPLMQNGKRNFSKLKTKYKRIRLNEKC